MPSKFRSSLTKPIGNPNLLNKKVPRNPKYSNVKASVRSGSHKTNVKVPIDTRHECFKRISRNGLNKLLAQVDQEEESIYDYRAQDTQSEYSVATTTDMSGMEVMLLDVREPSDFKECRIDGATNFPMALLRRDAFTREIHCFKNQNKKLIVVYHQEEGKFGQLAATLFSEKGYSNIRLLTGGLMSFGEKFPMRIVGALPVPPTPGRAPLSSRNGISRPVSSKSMKQSSRPSSVRSQRSTQGSVFRKTGRQTMSVRSNASATTDRAWR